MLEAIELSKSYGGHQALSNLNLSVAPGEVYCLLGANGAGKTTTINLFLGLIQASSGKALVKGLEVGVDRKAHELIAFIPEVVQLYGNMNAAENLAFFSRLAGQNLKPAELSELLDQVGLAASDHQKNLSGFSKGMRQKVGIAIALSKQAEVIFMDEPTSGLDPKATSEFTTICKGLVQTGKTIFMATHDIFNAVNVGSRIGIMKGGALIHSAATIDISANELQELYLKTI